jgi:Peptidase C13 family
MRVSFMRLIIIFVLSWLGAQGPALAQSMHYLGIAASSRETVFQSEVTGAGSTVGTIWKLGSSQTVSGSFFGKVTYGSVVAAIRAAASRMDTQKDVLFLLVSSHGGPNGGGVELSGGGAMNAGMLRRALDEAGIRNRIVVVSACYSGQFIGPLSGPTTAVITASNAQNPSFGCSNQRSYTYFGDAFFNYGLQQSGPDLRRAFGVARTTVTQWERRDGQRPSQPQISIGGRMGAVLSGIR